MRNVVHGIEPGQALLLQEMDGVALPLGEHRHEDVCASYLLVPRRLNVNCRALQDPLEAGCRLRVIAMSREEIGVLVVDVVQDLPAQPVEIHSPCTQHGDYVLILGKREEQVFERNVFVLALPGVSEGAVQRLFEIA